MRSITNIWRITTLLHHHLANGGKIVASVLKECPLSNTDASTVQMNKENKAFLSVDEIQRVIRPLFDLEMAIIKNYTKINKRF